jgi:hypothetical protein
LFFILRRANDRVAQNVGVCGSSGCPASFSNSLYARMNALFKGWTLTSSLCAAAARLA